MMVSPSSAQALVVAVEPKVRLLYEVLSLPIFRYRLVFVDWIVLPTLKYSPVATGPRTARVAEPRQQQSWSPRDGSRVAESKDI
jgi:hypothetical protein